MAKEPYTPDSEGFPMWGSPIEHEEAIEAFCKIVRYWDDHGEMDHIRCRIETPIGTIGEFIGEGMDWLWHFVVMPDRDASGKIIRNESKSVTG